MNLRHATYEDLKLLLDWANDPDVRNNAINTNLISLVEHENWFINLLSSKNNRIYIMSENEFPIGQIRFDLIKDIFWIDYSIQKNERGKGYAKKLLLSGIDRITDEFGSKITIKARVKSNNFPSINTFLKCGFKKSGIGLIDKIELIEFIY